MRARAPQQRWFPSGLQLAVGGYTFPYDFCDCRGGILKAEKWFVLQNDGLYTLLTVRNISSNTGDFRLMAHALLEENAYQVMGIRTTSDRILVGCRIVVDDEFGGFEVQVRSAADLSLFFRITPLADGPHSGFDPQMDCRNGTLAVSLKGVTRYLPNFILFFTSFFIIMWILLQ